MIVDHADEVDVAAGELILIVLDDVVHRLKTAAVLDVIPVPQLHLDKRILHGMIGQDHVGNIGERLELMGDLAARARKAGRRRGQEVIIGRAGYLQYPKAETADKRYCEETDDNLHFYLDRNVPEYFPKFSFHPLSSKKPR